LRARLEVTMLKRRKQQDRGCSGHPRGRPKITHGLCYGNELRAAVKERIRGHRLERSWIRSPSPEDEDL
jgi:hypothetical protein